MYPLPCVYNCLACWSEGEEEVATGEEAITECAGFSLNASKPDRLSSAQYYAVSVCLSVCPANIAAG